VDDSDYLLKTGQRPIWAVQQQCRMALNGRNLFPLALLWIIIVFKGKNEVERVVVSDYLVNVGQRPIWAVQQQCRTAPNG
jgi:hypothetical protein